MMLKGETGGKQIYTIRYKVTTNIPVKLLTNDLQEFEAKCCFCEDTLLTGLSYFY